MTKVKIYIDPECRLNGHTYAGPVPPGPRKDECERCHAVRKIEANGRRTYIYPPRVEIVEING